VPFAAVLLIAHGCGTFDGARVAFAIALIVMHAAGRQWDCSNGERARETRWERSEPGAARDAQVCEADRFRVLRYMRNRHVGMTVTNGQVPYAMV
jgi:hypothetical protein